MNALYKKLKKFSPMLFIFSTIICKKIISKEFSIKVLITIKSWQNTKFSSLEKQTNHASQKRPHPLSQTHSLTSRTHVFPISLSPSRRLPYTPFYAVIKLAYLALRSAVQKQISPHPPPVPHNTTRTLSLPPIISFHSFCSLFA